MGPSSTTSLHIQCPSGLNPHEWPLKSSARVRKMPFHKTPEGRRMVSNKIWSCATLQEHIEDCAFIGFDVEGNYWDPTQVGLSYLPELPPTPIKPGMLHGCLEFPNDALCSELWSLNIKPREEVAPRHTPCPFATHEASIHFTNVEGLLVELLSSWKAQSGKKYLVIVGFGTDADLTVLIDQWPTAALLFDGWLDTQDLARGTRARADVHGGMFPSMSKMTLHLGIRELTMGLSHNAGADALMAMALMIAAWDAFTRGEELDIPPPKPPTCKRQRVTSFSIKRS
ncbi:hypothetical protein PG991_005493 [Apiospora marii]|uniref:Exonuclease domain-containing protein n=1 Tax=Apiospora marii TaxID=335849 RepID=A0ABR1SBJ7_9PEZI